MISPSGVPVASIYVDAGDTPTLVISIAVEDGLPFDFGNAEAIFVAAKSVNAVSPGPDIIFEKKTADGQALFDTVDGVPVLKVPLLRADTSGVAAGKYWFEAVILENAGTMRSHILKGPFHILKAVKK